MQIYTFQSFSVSNFLTASSNTSRFLLFFVAPSDILISSSSSSSSYPPTCNKLAFSLLILSLMFNFAA